MTRVSEIADPWLGLCRKPPAVHALQTGLVLPPESSCQGLPDGGGSGSGAIRRGIRAAFSGMETLNRNRQLLWFTLLTGIVLAGTTICQGALCYIGWVLSDEILLRLVLTFFIEFFTVFCMVILLAALVLSIASKNEGAASFAEGLAGAKKFLSPLILYSFVLALAGILLSWVFWFHGGLFWPAMPYLINLLTQYPFALHLNPATFAEIPGYGGRTVLFWTYPYGLEKAFEFFTINLLMFILTAFVVPLIVLEQKTIRESVAGSVALMKKTWTEVIACVLFLGIIVTGVFLTFVLVQVAHGMATPPPLLYDRPPLPWLAAGILWYLALFSTAFVAATVGGIALLDLYHKAKMRGIVR